MGKHFLNNLKSVEQLLDISKTSKSLQCVFHVFVFSDYVQRIIVQCHQKRTTKESRSHRLFWLRARRRDGCTPKKRLEPKNPKAKRSISERLEDRDALVFRGLDQLHPCFAREGFTVAIPEQRTLSLCQQDSLIPSGVFSSEGHRHWEAG